jgi:cytochrome c5
MLRLTLTGACALILILMVGCGDSTSPTGTQGAPGVNPASLEPIDPALAAIYNRSCRSCHATGASQAPLSGVLENWAPRLEQGLDVLLDHTINGYGGMPPMGMCFDCDEAQFTALIRFMSGEGS